VSNWFGCPIYCSGSQEKNERRSLHCRSTAAAFSRSGSTVSASDELSGDEKSCTPLNRQARFRFIHEAGLRKGGKKKMLNGGWTIHDG
jgi:hypothetical protein